MGGKQEQAEDLVRHGPEYVPGQPEIPEGLGHFFAFDIQVAVVEPGAGQGFSGQAFALGVFVFMVGKDQVRPAAVDVKTLSQVFHGHGRAFDVPARAALAPGGIPGRFARLGGLPQRKIQRVALAHIHFDPRAFFQLLDVLSGQPAVLRKASHLEVDVSVQHVGVAGVD